MAEKSNGRNGVTDDASRAADAPAPIQAKIINQYLKDLSFENPNVRKLMAGLREQPNIEVEVNVATQRLDADIYESAIELKAKATAKIGVIWILETVYAGALKVEKVPEQALEPFLMITGPSMLFPFLRRIVADVVREGGFPPLMLDPIDFAALYFHRQKEAAGAKAEA